MSEQSESGARFGRRDLTVISIVALVATALVSYAVMQVRESSRRVNTSQCLRQLGAAVHTAVGDHKRLPPSGTGVATGTEFTPGGFGKKTGSLYLHLLPYIEGPMHIYNGGAWDVCVYVYHTSQDPSENGTQSSGTSFPFNGLVFNQGGNEVGKNLSEAMPDGTSNTVLFSSGAIESNTLRDASAPNPVTCIVVDGALPQFTDWYPGKAKLNTFQSFTPGTIGVLMGDANTRGVSAGVSAQSWSNAMVPNDKRNPGSDF
jgi:type II secretory pathway pseudopilin PulG